ncbi:hypothetical protein STANM309S_01726 [Streptomyces tanashiensis]
MGRAGARHGLHRAADLRLVRDGPPATSSEWTGAGGTGPAPAPVQFFGFDNGSFHDLLFPAAFRAYDPEIALPRAFVVNELGAAELLDPGVLGARFPGLSVDGVTAAVWEPEAGYADPPRTARVYRDRALAHGARRLPARVRALDAPPGADPVRVLLEPGGPVEAFAVVLAAGGGPGRSPGTG